jgi:hypothetical protein
MDMISMLFDGMGYSVGVEVGVYEGEFSSQILRGCDVEVLHSVDPWAGTGMRREYDAREVYATAKSTLREFGDRSNIIRKTSEDAAGMFADKSIDFCYIDAAHDYESIKRDIELWLPKVRHCGILAGHDYKKKPRCGVIRAVNEAFGDNVNVTTEMRAPSWWVVV